MFYNVCAVVQFYRMCYTSVVDSKAPGKIPTIAEGRVVLTYNLREEADRDEDTNAHYRRIRHC